MDKMNIPATCKPFDLEAALAGDAIITREGASAKFVAYLPECAPDSQLAVTVRLPGFKYAMKYRYRTDGKWVDSEDHPLDLFMVPKTVTRWVNVHKSRFTSGYSTGETTYLTEQEAKDSIIKNTYIKTLQITFEE